ASATKGESQDLMSLCVKMQERVKPVAPRVGPAVFGEQDFKTRGRIAARFKDYRRTVKEERKTRVIGSFSVILKVNCIGLSSPKFDILRPFRCRRLLLRDASNPPALT